LRPSRPGGGGRPPAWRWATMAAGGWAAIRASPLRGAWDSQTWGVGRGAWNKRCGSSTEAHPWERGAAAWAQRARRRAAPAPARPLAAPPHGWRAADGRQRRDAGRRCCRWLMRRRPGSSGRLVRASWAVGQHRGGGRHSFNARKKRLCRRPAANAAASVAAAAARCACTGDRRGCAALAGRVMRFELLAPPPGFAGGGRRPRRLGGPGAPAGGPPTTRPPAQPSARVTAPHSAARLAARQASRSYFARSSLRQPRSLASRASPGSPFCQPTQQARGHPGRAGWRPRALGPRRRKIDARAAAPHSRRTCAAARWPRRTGTTAC